MSKKITYIPDLEDIPEGVCRRLMTVLQSCIGKHMAINRERINEILEKYDHVTLDDRALRRAVEKIRNQGIRVCDLENGDGLFIAETQDEYDHFKMRYASHAFSLIKTIRAMDDGISSDKLPNNFDDLVNGIKPMQISLF